LARRASNAPSMEIPPEAPGGEFNQAGPWRAGHIHSGLEPLRLVKATLRDAAMLRVLARRWRAWTSLAKRCVAANGPRDAGTLWLPLKAASSFARRFRGTSHRRQRRQLKAKKVLCSSLDAS